MKIKRIIICFLLILTSQLVFAEIYKCKSSSGKVIYSESKCPSGTLGDQINLDFNVIDSSAIRNKIAREKALVTDSNYQSSASIENASANYMSAHDRQNRLRELSIDMKDDHAYYEKVADAKKEYSYLSNPNVFSLSYDDEIKRKNLKIDLNDLDRLKRSIAFRQLSDLYGRYLSKQIN